MTQFLYVHSADRTFGTPNDFQVTLARPIALSPGSRLRVDNLRLPNCLMTIDEGRQNLYFQLQGQADTYSQLPVGFYTALQFGTILTNYLSGPHMASTYDATRNTLQLDYKSGTEIFQIYTDEDIASGKYQGPFPPGASRGDPQSCNSVLRNDDGKYMTTWLNNHCSFRINFLNVSPFDFVYLRSKALASRHAATCRGGHDVLCMIPVNGGFGEILVGETPWNTSQEVVATSSLNQLDFQVTDRYHRPIKLLADISFQLTFFE